MMSDAAHGTISAHRTSARPGNSLARNWARPSESSSVTPTTLTTHTTVVATTAGSASCCTSRT